MMASFLYILLGILGISFLIFIHELGHYFMARRVGMRVETFSIGFGTPLYSWEWQGTKWQIGWLLFGGFVKIAGMDGSDSRDPYTIPDGFFGKSPWDRIKVAFAGPFVNLVFALLVFLLIFALGGREKRFADFTPKVGWVDPKSELYLKGLRPGDEISAYDDQPFNSFKDHIYSLLGKDEVVVSGYKLYDPEKGKVPFEYHVKTYPNPATVDSSIKTAGILQSSRYLIYDRYPGGAENPLPEGSPMIESGIEYGDRIVWLDGHTLYSDMQLSRLINEERALLTIERDNQVLLRRAPRVQVRELRPTGEFKEELVDWQYEAGLQNKAVADLYTIPYNLTPDAVVESKVRFIDQEGELEAFPPQPYSSLERPLVSGDKILAVDGSPIQHSYELFKKLQSRHVLMIVQRDKQAVNVLPVDEANQAFNTRVNRGDLNEIANSIGTNAPITSEGILYLLKPITPVKQKDLFLTPERSVLFETVLQQRKKEIEGIEDPERRTAALERLSEFKNKLVVGVPLQDKKVIYNPSPLKMFYNVFNEIYRTLLALVTGSLKLEWVSGPIGIVNVVKTQWSVGIKEALFWIGAISLNLGIINLLPIPVLDGGTIVMSAIEMITRRRLSSRTYEKLIVFFGVMLVGFFLYITYHDLLRIFT